jgi:hypothetical protein
VRVKVRFRVRDGVRFKIGIQNLIKGQENSYGERGGSHDEQEGGNMVCKRVVICEKGDVPWSKSQRLVS